MPSTLFKTLFALFVWLLQSGIIMGSNEAKSPCYSLAKDVPSVVWDESSSSYVCKSGSGNVTCNAKNGEVQFKSECKFKGLTLGAIAGIVIGVIIILVIVIVIVVVMKKKKT